MATWGEASNFTWSELADMGLTWGDLREVSFPELLSIAHKKLDRFKTLPPEKQGRMMDMVPLLETILAGVAANLISDMVLSADWKKLLMEAIKLLNRIAPQ